MNNKQVERFLDTYKADLAGCLRGVEWSEDSTPDTISVPSNPNELRERFEDDLFDLFEGQPLNGDGVDWQAKHKDLTDYADWVYREYKKLWDEREKSCEF
jgi:hypothetical protein